MDKKIIRHAYNRKAMASDYENDEGGISLTIPDHTMSIREIVTRYASGRGINASIKNPIYNGEEVELPDLKKMDLAEIGQLLETTRENKALLEHQLEQELLITKTLQKEEEQKQKQQEDERLLKLYEERLRKQQTVQQL